MWALGLLALQCPTAATPSGPQTPLLVAAVWGAGTASFRPVAAHAANCELRADRLRANVALRSPASVPLAILAACYGAVLEQQDGWDDNAHSRAAPTEAAWSARAAVAAGRSASTQRLQIACRTGVHCNPSKRQGGWSAQRSTPN